MNQASKAITKATGMSMKDFCEKHLNTKLVSFQVRMRNNSLYPNEYLYICLVTGKRFEDLFGHSFNDSMLLVGDVEVTKKLKKMLQQEGAWKKLNELIADMKRPDALKLSLVTQVGEGPEKQKAVDEFHETVKVDTVAKLLLGKDDGEKFEVTYEGKSYIVNKNIADAAKKLGKTLSQATDPGNGPARDVSDSGTKEPEEKAAGEDVPGYVETY